MTRTIKLAEKNDAIDMVGSFEQRLETWRARVDSHAEIKLGLMHTRSNNGLYGFPKQSLDLFLFETGKIRLESGEIIDYIARAGIEVPQTRTLGDVNLIAPSNVNLLRGRNFILYNDSERGVVFADFAEVRAVWDELQNAIKELEAHELDFSQLCPEFPYDRKGPINISVAGINYFNRFQHCPTTTQPRVYHSQMRREEGLEDIIFLPGHVNIVMPTKLNIC